MLKITHHIYYNLKAFFGNDVYFQERLLMFDYLKRYVVLLSINFNAKTNLALLEMSSLLQFAPLYTA